MTPTLQQVRDALSYDPETGVMRWLFTKGRCVAGNEAGWIGTQGYRCLKFCGVETTAARFAWFHFYGGWPDHELECVNENRLDISISNLRPREASPPILLDAVTLRRMLHYDPSSGDFSKLVKSKKHSIGDAVGWKQGHTYRRCKIMVGGQTYMAHRLAWLYVYGEWPTEDIDHRDGDSCNNRIANLRLATDSQNLGNMRKPATNKSGKKGVSWHVGGARWQAHIKIDGVNKYLGLFDTVDAAHAAYCKAAVDGRGQFARFE